MFITKNINNAAPAVDEKIRKDVEVLAEFIHIYCADRHPNAVTSRAESGGAVGRYLAPVEFSYCTDCLKLLLHAASKRVLCPHDPKPACKKCETHCYGPGYREKIQEVMRYSGMRLIKKGRFDLIKKYFS
jgi:hypothetical protein